MEQQPRVLVLGFISLRRAREVFLNLPGFCLIGILRIAKYDDERDLNILTTLQGPARCFGFGGA